MSGIKFNGKPSAELDAALIAEARANAKYSLAMARNETAAAKLAELELARETDSRRRELAANEHHHVYHFTDAVGATSTRACMKQLATWKRTEPGCAVEIVFSSPGGSVIDGLALFDYIQQIRKVGHKVTTSTLGYAASMAGILLQAGDLRTMGAEAYILVHEVSFGIDGKIGEVEDEVAFIKKIQGRVLDIFASRTKLSKVQLARRWRRKDWWLDSTEALALGFVDKVV